MSNKTLVLAVTVENTEQARELMTMFNSIMYTIDHDPAIDALWMASCVGDPEHGDPWTHTFIGKLLKEELYYDDNTMLKVREIIEAGPYGGKSVDEVINELQNAGILFRERAKDDE